jgi:L-threonylcarbamoyladenylate synthase
VSRVISADALEAITEAVAALKRGEVIAIPTETVYGLAVLPVSKALDLLIAAKQRSAEKGIQLLVASIEQVASMAILTASASALAARFWPGGLTIVLRQRADIELPEQLGGGRPTLGIRFPDHPVPQALARVLGPLAASSANVSGQPDATTAGRVAEALFNEVSLILDDGPVRGGIPSTVVDCSDPDAPPRILREGAISAADIAEALR